MLRFFCNPWRSFCSFSYRSGSSDGEKDFPLMSYEHENPTQVKSYYWLLLPYRSEPTIISSKLVLDCTFMADKFAPTLSCP